ncbi:hypothetical protein [Adlercreutzia sp. ZJ305]|uniref:hypothetical protein n=1 Tax=Adlercreutzia sp. ZJ305 TaxID=2709408 RepID=UPI0013ED6739|nr:hypothetical protein [Adlercreutzia sp. ZJ305]
MLLVLVVITTCLAVTLHARFASEGESQDAARVAGFAFMAEGKDRATFNLSSIKKPGDSKDYTFTVSNGNTDGTVVSEVALQCSFTVQLNGSMPLVCTIKEQSTGDAGAARGAGDALVAAGTETAEGEGGSGGSDGESGPGSSTLTVRLEDGSASPVEKTGQASQFAAATPRTDTYVLTATWPKEKNDAKYASRNAVAEVRLTVRAEQID